MELPETIRCSNKNMYTKINELVHMIKTGSEILARSGVLLMDAAVITEMTMMGSLSMKCNHTPSKQPNTIAYERGHVHDIPSYVEDVCVNMCGSLYTSNNAKTRENMVTCAIISDCVSMLEFRDRYSHMGGCTASIFCMDMLSVTHAATVAFVFECVSAYMSWDGLVSMTIVTDENTAIAMNAYVGPRQNVNVVWAKDPHSHACKLVSNCQSQHRTLIVHENEMAYELMNRYKMPNLILNLLVSVTTLEHDYMIRRFCKDSDMLTEMCPCSHSGLNVVRIIPRFLCGDITLCSIKIRDIDTTTFGKMRWYEKMVRRMPVDGVCYDCWMAFTLSRAVLSSITQTEVSTDLQQGGLPQFSATMSTAGILD